jgi:hypothetical protein
MLRDKSKTRVIGACMKMVSLIVGIAYLFKSEIKGLKNSVPFKGK